MEITSLDGPLGKYDVIYVSPHLDDAVFSCSAHIRSQLELGKKVLVATVFTSGPSCSTSSKDSLSPFLNVEERSEEDRAAMHALGVDFHHMGLSELLFRWGGREVAFTWVAGIAFPERDVENRVANMLKRLIGKTQCPWVIGPAAIGFHPDHLIVYRACQQVADLVPRFWLYYDFPYCTYPILTRARRWVLHVQSPFREVEDELSLARLADRKRLLALYSSQVEAVFGSEEGLGQALDACPNEIFLESLEVRRAAGEEDSAELPLPKASAHRILKHMLGIDLTITVWAFFLVRFSLDWSDTNIHAMRFAYAVIIFSAVRVLCIVTQASVVLSGWLCMSSTFLTAAAFSYIVGVRSMALALYYSLQIWLGCAEETVANWLRKRPVPENTEPLKVLVISDYMPPQKHGISTHTYGLACALRSLACQVHVYTTEGKADDSTFLTWSIQNPWNKDVRLSICPSFRLFKTLFGGHWSVVHVVMPSLIPWPVMFTAWLVGVPVYASQHCDLERLGKLYTSSFVYHLGNFGYCLFSHLPIYLFSTVHAAPTNGYINSHPVMRHFAKERLAVVPSSLDASIFHNVGQAEDRLALRTRLGLGEDTVVWLVVARLAPEKDIYEVLHALKYQREHWPEEARPPVLVIAGDGPLRSELESMAVTNQLPVHFLGFVQLEEVAGLYRACDVCATNSVQETFGLTVIEALASGCPMVMPHCEVFDELYGDTLGEWMYRKGDVRELAEAMRAASQPSARGHLLELRQQNRFNRNLFWSWQDAATEQMAQYRRAQYMLQERRARLGATFRASLMLISLLICLAVILVASASECYTVSHSALQRGSIIP